MEGSISTATTELPGGDYNEIPYVSNPFPQTEPSRLFGTARLFGLTPPPIETARILEIGCASGGNLIPLAERYPAATFLGIDITPLHVAQANARIAALGLSNIDIRQADVTTVELPDASFDCIICHGVYSWVPAAARAAILRLAANALSADGLAYISYNVFPGWQMRGVIRDLMLFHAGTDGPPAQRIAKARWVLDNLARLVPEGQSYGARLREEAKALSSVADSYILGEFLAPFNEPCYFRDFFAAAETAGLMFLSEAEIETCLPETHGPEVAALIRTMSASQLVPLEQYIDFLVGRQFRQSLLVRADQAARIVRQLAPSAVRGLHVAGRLEPAAISASQERYTFTSPSGRNVTTASPVVAEALRRLGAAYPENRTAEELAAEVAGAGMAVDGHRQSEIYDVVLQMIVAGIVRPASAPVRIGCPDGERPDGQRPDGGRLLARPLARADAAAGGASTVNLWHEPTPIDAVGLVLLPLLDGSNGRAKLRRKLIAAVERGRIDMTDNATGAPLRGEALEKAAHEHVELALKRLADRALLMPAQKG